ncbi:MULTISPECIES: hypothetical protein [unclassified Mesorhizobium]|uniref:hypothetical protein n=1 Tax=unclassified Mesorhizobium TaxID=325217 RepID=UPI00112841C4|nr:MULTISPECIES: hypothetical protein [unclassified Mesorhizobium]TPJ51745.1 hypothetical protein FJ426_18740 [Mesorhizobium sp. B2-6-4]TPN42367.1 hypothetical protein FJ979_02155 [Mesorhizobium sp. B1-1-6]
MSQPLYRIVATRRCKTHRPGTTLDFTGPRSSLTKGWRVVGRYQGKNYVTNLSGMQFDIVEYR